jgi:hypothetical protein
MTLTYSSLLSAPVTAALQAKERFVLAALRTLPAEGEFRWTTWTTPGEPDCYVLRHTSDSDRCLVWFSLNELQKKLTETFIAAVIGGRTRTVPGNE